MGSSTGRGNTVGRNAAGRTSGSGVPAMSEDDGTTTTAVTPYLNFKRQEYECMPNAILGIRSGSIYVQLCLQLA